MSKAKGKAAATKLAVQLDWLAGPQHVGFVEALKQGYYRRRGLDVRLVQGKGSRLTLNLVGEDHMPIGIADAVQTALAISRGVPVRVIGVILEQSPSAIFYHSGTTFRTPVDMKGKTLLTVAGDMDRQLLPAVLSRYGMKLSDLHIVTLQVSAQYATFARSEHALMTGFETNIWKLRKLNPDISYRTYADFGVNPYSTALVANDQELKNHPGVVRSFMAASAQGWAYAAKHPKQAVADTVAMFPNANATTLSHGLQVDLRSLHTAATKGRPFGWMAQSDWRQTISLAHRYLGLTHPLPLSAYYTNRFIASSS